MAKVEHNGVLRSSRSPGPPPVSGEGLHHRSHVLVFLDSLYAGYIYMPKARTPTRYGGISTVHITTDNDQRDKMGEVAQTMSRTTHMSAYTAMDYALKAQEINTKLLQQTTQAW